LIITGQIFLSGISRFFEINLHPLYQFPQNGATAFSWSWINPKPLEIYLADYDRESAQNRRMRDAEIAGITLFFVFGAGNTAERR